ncbi:PLP-dependent aminotransferase family protein [Streptomyces pini]|uniref:DNA-binding transcriptional regulator, MocR family, contains an aminotransferase domain n=1 Tax=Streptomyces pini TaxID=1520580 RepID=A0A1I4E1D4_9ACTN|nr:PLP-dependent aminotransferase family protein [Streptomyces pini]SFK98347.1 DNA-binding transcriptional regulator, MocR family, contains an aminotransferase domain [Streptomyces pini]
MDDYRRIADGMAADIAAGRLRPGDRLPTQREFARRRGIAGSTAARVYRELARRGLTVGEVGRGTFVRASARTADPAVAEPAEGRIDLEFNHPVVPEQSALLAAGIAPLLRPDVLESATRPVGPAGTAAARNAAAGLLARGGWRPDPDRVLFAGGGRQAIAAAIAALVPPGGRLGAEELTYPVLRSVAGRLGVEVVPLSVDGEGVVPQVVAEAHRAAPLAAVYLQPTVHNPLGLVTPPRRLAELAEVLGRLGVAVIEDAVWAFLRDVPPLAALLPERTVLVDSLSKRLAPGLTAGYAVAPNALVSAVAAALRSGGWGPARFALDAAGRWWAEGAVDEIVRAKRRDASARREIAARRLEGFAVGGDPSSYFCWWELPPPWRADTFVAAAARHGIAVTPAAAFAADGLRAPHAVRLALASPPPDVLARALDTLAALARSGPEQACAE